MTRLAALSLALWLAPTARATDTKGEVFASGRAIYGWNYGWTITLSKQGMVLVERELGKPPETYLLSPAERQAFARTLEVERPWEMPAELGDAVIDGPERTLEIRVAGRSARFIIRHTPQGVSRTSLLTDRSAFARAFRICEAVRKLGRDLRLQPCVDIE